MAERQQLMKRLYQLQEQYWKAPIGERMRIVREMQAISEQLGLLQSAPFRRSTNLTWSAISAMAGVGELPKAKRPLPYTTIEEAAEKAIRPGRAVKQRIYETMLEVQRARRAAQQAAAQEVKAAPTVKEAAKQMSKAARRPPWTKEASEKWLEIHKQRIEQAAKRTEVMDRTSKWLAGVLGLGVAANVFEGAAVIYNAIAGNKDSARLIQYQMMQSADQQAFNKLWMRSLEQKEKDYELRVLEFLRKTGQIPTYTYGGRLAQALTFEQLMALERAKHEMIKERGQAAAQAELAKIREAVMWTDWREAREAAREMALEKQKGEIKAILQQHKYDWENYLQERKGQIEAFLTDKEQAWQAWREYWDDVRDHTAKLTEQYQKAVLEDELARRAATYEVAKTAAKAQIETAALAAKEQIQFYWERKRDFIKAVRDHARVTQIDATKLWDMWQKELKRIKRAIEKGESYLAALQVPGAPTPVLIRVDPKRPGVVTMVTPEGKEVTL